ncbi:hypothetical protein CI610_03548 [invertebrate metagenome]|uniref:Reverse transcriptase domain-containing protein n=1 Tax=invertebrate metagenome TaxID=1711999 RepID=A0A2H9T2V7_9ZZZZ
MNYRKAEVLAKFFSSVFTQEPQGDLPEFKPRNITFPFEDIIVNSQLVEKLLSNLNENKSQGPDNMNPRVLKELRKNISEPVADLFNKSLSDGKLPQAWKEANITAIFKKGAKSDPGNYRPVSLTSIIVKTLEKLVRDSIVKHMDKNDLLSSKQFGFISGRSTQLQLLTVLEEWTDIIDKGGQLDVIYMDFMKAFDKVPHQRLLKKLTGYGISQKIVKWIEDFLSNRCQRVIVKGKSSKTYPVISGIPQGSVLGPILFVIYINDLPEITASQSPLFADDTKLYRQINSNDDVQILQNDLDKLQIWSNTWLLKFHPKKCKVLSIKSSEKRQYYMSGPGEEKFQLENITCEKDIGVMIDEDLNFKKHIQLSVNKANSIVGLIRRSFVYLDESMFTLLFKALVRPHLEYAASVWNPFRINDIDLIENVQRRATKLIPGLKTLSYSERLERLNLPTLSHRRTRGDVINVFKIMNNIYDSRVTKNFFQMDNNNRTRGHSQKIFKKRCRRDARKHFFSYRIVDLWNSLPQHVINAETVYQFEILLDNYWKNNRFIYKEQ